jgi:signal peptidase I
MVVSAVVDVEARIPWWRVQVSPARRAVGVALLMSAAYFYAMLGLGMRFFAIASISMEPTLHESDRILALPSKTYNRGDLVVLKDPLSRNGHIVKRVIALPGDRVEVSGGALHVNGVYISEPYRPEPIDYSLRYVVPKDSVFVLGDNANWSVDSHNWAAAFKDVNGVVPGAVPLTSIVGRVRYRYLPLSRFGPVEPFPIDSMLAL